MFGQITESLCNELFWNFDKEDFKNALAHFVFEDDETDEDFQLVKNIKMRFNKLLQAEYKGTITDWVKEMFKKVSYMILDSNSNLI